MWDSWGNCEVEKYSRPVVEIVVLRARGWGVTNQELFQVPFERKWRALSNHPTKKIKNMWLRHCRRPRRGLDLPKSAWFPDFSNMLDF